MPGRTPRPASSQMRLRSSSDNVENTGASGRSINRPGALADGYRRDAGRSASAFCGPITATSMPSASTSSAWPPTDATASTTTIAPRALGEARDLGQRVEDAAGGFGMSERDEIGCRIVLERLRHRLDGHRKSRRGDQIRDFARRRASAIRRTTCHRGW